MTDGIIFIVCLAVVILAGLVWHFMGAIFRRIVAFYKKLKEIFNVKHRENRKNDKER